MLLWCAFLFGYGVNTGTLYRTEALRAIIGREALHGSWFVPMLYGEPFLTKPPGMYAAIATASLPFGEVSTISARLPSVLAATVTVFLFFGTFRRVVDSTLALVGAMLMPVSLLWLDKAPSAEIDMLQVMWVSAALLCFLRALEAEELEPAASARASEMPLLTLRALGWWLLALLCVTAGFLTKWTAPAFFYLSVVPLLIWRRQLALLLGWRHLLSVGVSVGFVALWASAVAAQVGWQPLIDSVYLEAAQRLHPHHRGRAYPWLESLSFPGQVLVANLPWSLFALYSLRPAFLASWDENGRRLLQLLHCWTWPNLLFWSLPAQHHVRYCLPMCPGVVGLGVMVCLGWARHSKNPQLDGRLDPFSPDKSGAISKSVIILLLAWSIVKIVHVEIVVPQRTSTRNVRETASRLAELVPSHEILYICKLKDEGILFYYNRPTQRFRIEDPPQQRHALLMESEWKKCQEQVEIVAWLRDQQGAPIVLVRH